MIDITPIVNAVIALIGIVITVILIPYIKSKTTEAQQAVIFAIVQTAVFGFEQIVQGEKQGEEKFQLAIENIQAALLKRNIKFDYEEIRLMIESVVGEMNLSKE